MANSALQPKSPLRVFTTHAPSQLRLKPVSEPPYAPGPPLDPPPWPSFVTCPSYSSPAGFVPKTKPFWRSR